MDKLKFDPKSESAGYFYFQPDGTLSTRGFCDLWDKNVRFSELEGAVILAHDDEEIPVEECIMFDAETLANRNVIKYLTERRAVNCLFVKIFGIYSQCPSAKIELDTEVSKKVTPIKICK